MYFIPGYVSIERNKTDIFLESQILHNKVRINNPDYMRELDYINEKGCKELSTPLTKFLHEQEVLVNEQEANKILSKFHDLMSDYLQFTIMPTEACNFRCTYCYENHEPVVMNQKKLEDIKLYIISKALKAKILQIHWFGGEPTLCDDIVVQMSRCFKSVCESNNVDYCATMTTNGYLLTADMFKKFYNEGIESYQITLDGWSHDKTRPHITGKATLQTIIDNLLKISALPKDKYRFSIILRHNILPDSTDFSWYDYLKKLFGLDKRFSILVRPVGDWGGETVKTLKLLKQNAADEVGRHLKYIKDIGMRTVNGDHNKPFSKICYANYPNSAVFRANGKIEKCTVCLDNPKNYIGYLDDKLGVQINSDINSGWSHFELQSKCYRCPAVLTCMNLKCPKKLLIDGVDSENCDYILSDNF